jgi:hypothetical protein
MDRVIVFPLCVFRSFVYVVVFRYDEKSSFAPYLTLFPKTAPAGNWLCAVKREKFLTPHAHRKK